MIRKFEIILDVDKKFCSANVEEALDTYLDNVYDGTYIEISEIKETTKGSENLIRTID